MKGEEHVEHLRKLGIFWRPNSEETIYEI